MAPDDGAMMDSRPPHGSSETPPSTMGYHTQSVWTFLMHLSLGLGAGLRPRTLSTTLCWELPPPTPLNASAETTLPTL